MSAERGFFIDIEILVELLYGKMDCIKSASLLEVNAIFELECLRDLGLAIESL